MLLFPRTPFKSPKRNIKQFTGVNKCMYNKERQDGCGSEN